VLVAASQAGTRTQRYQALHDALLGVVYNGQALAAADQVIGLVITARDLYAQDSIDAARAWAYQELDDALRDVQRYRGTVAGMPNDLISDATWDDLSHAIGRAYNVMWSIQDTIGTDSETAATARWIGEAAEGTLQALPGIIRGAVHLASETATDLTGGIAAGLLPLWPLVLIAGALVVAGVVVVGAGRKRGLLK
jgi:hypothetical protein